MTRRHYRRHPAEVTADRLTQHAEEYVDKLDGQERDDFGIVIHILQEIAEGNR